MSASEYIKEIRAGIGNSLLMIPGVAGVIFDNDRNILLQEKSDKTWSLPAGMIEPGESPKAAIVREVQEETGLIVVPERVLGLFGGDQYRYLYPNGDAVEYTIILFKCVVVRDTGFVSDPETQSLQYFDKESMPELALPYPKNVLFDELTETYM